MYLHGKEDNLTVTYKERSVRLLSFQNIFDIYQTNSIMESIDRIEKTNLNDVPM